MNEMTELRLLFNKEKEDHYFVRLDNNWGGNATEPLRFDFTLSEEDFDDQRWYLEEFMDLPDGGSIVRARRIEQNLDKWGKALYHDIFKTGDNRELLNYLQQQKPPRLLTIATRDPQPLRLPWELMADSRGPLFRQDITIRRQLETARAPIQYQTGLPLRILLIVSRPGDLGFIDPRLSSRYMLDALDTLGNDVRLDFCRPPTLTRLEELLSQARRRNEAYHIVHFDGHGTFLPEIELGALCFELPDSAVVLADSKTDYVRADRLGDLLARYEIPLVILEACRSGAAAKVAVFRSVAPRLIEAGVGSVISMSHAVHVEAARILLEKFYQELVTGVSVGQALEQGRAALIANPRRWLEYGPGARTVELKDWFLPNLYQRGQDLLLVPERPARIPPASKARSESAISKPFDVFLSHNHADSNRVERIALQLKNKYGLRVWLDKWEVGPGPLHDQCHTGLSQSRFILLAISQAALDSEWVAAEQNWARAYDPQGWHIIPLLFEKLHLPEELQSLRWVDMTDSSRDMEGTAEIAALIAAETGKDRPAESPSRFRPVTRDKEQVGAFPPAPIYKFHGRARELYELERQLRSHRAILLHAMGGMGKTTLAAEAAHWWTRTGLFPDGACFLSFEQFASAERISQALGAYLEGVNFNALSAEEQRKRAKKLFHDNKVLMVWDNFESVLPQFSGTKGSDGVMENWSDASNAPTLQYSHTPKLQHSSAPLLYSDAERSRIFDLFRDWTDGAGNGRLLITCRPAEAGLPGARKHELHGLARPDSLWLLVRVLETAGVRLDDKRLSRDRLNKLLDLLSDHPLSIELVGPHLGKLTPEEIIADFGRLLAEFKRGAGEERNESLLASLAFSTSRLSEAAQAALPWLGLFSGGVFEYSLLEISGMKPAEWEAVRAELEATALIRVERDLMLGDRPYLRFHPTLTYAVTEFPLSPAFGGEGRGEEATIRRRFIEAYRSVSNAAYKFLFGKNPKLGMELLAHEEANYRKAVSWALADKQYAIASDLGVTFQRYLQRSGRLRERDAWVAYLSAGIQQGGFTEAAASYEQDEAWTLFTQGKGEEAIRRLQELLQRLKTTTDFDPAFQLALTQQMLGRVLHACGLSEQAIPVLEEAEGQWESLVATASADQAETRQGNLSVTLGDLANALLAAGRLDEAIAAAAHALEIDRELGRDREIATGLGRCARILMEQGKYAEADARYDDAIAAARRAGDRDLEGTVLQHQARLAQLQQQYARATDLYQRALKLFQEINAEAGVMQTLNWLGVVEQHQGRLAEARTWYERSRELARRLSNVQSLADAAQNIGIVCQLEGEAARRQGNEPVARQRFEEAKQSLQESLRLKQQLGNKPAEALAWGQLAQVHLLLDELDEAERHAHQAREINESLGLKEVHMDYQDLADIARARGNAAQAAEWERKRDAVRAELKRRAQGPGGLPPQLLQAIQGIALACARAGVERRDLEPGVESALSQMAGMPAPLSELAGFFRRLSAGELPGVPGGLPGEIAQFLEQVLAAVREARQ